MQIVLRPAIKCLGDIRNSQLQSIRNSVRLTTSATIVHSMFMGGGLGQNSLVKHLQCKGSYSTLLAPKKRGGVFGDPLLEDYYEYQNHDTAICSALWQARRFTFYVKNLNKTFQASSFEKSCFQTLFLLDNISTISLTEKKKLFNL